MKNAPKTVRTRANNGVISRIFDFPAAGAPQPSRRLNTVIIRETSLSHPRLGAAIATVCRARSRLLGWRCFRPLQRRCIGNELRDVDALSKLIRRLVLTKLRNVRNFAAHDDSTAKDQQRT